MSSHTSKAQHNCAVIKRSSSQIAFDYSRVAEQNYVFSGNSWNGGGTSYCGRSNNLYFPNEPLTIKIIKKGNKTALKGYVCIPCTYKDIKQQKKGHHTTLVPDW